MRVLSYRIKVQGSDIIDSSYRSQSMHTFADELYKVTGKHYWINSLSLDFTQHQ